MPPFGNAGEESGHNGDPVDQLQALQIRQLEERLAGQRGWWRNVLWVGVLAAFAWLLFNIQGTLVVFALAWLIAYLLNPAVKLLEGRRLGPLKSCTRGQAVGILYVLLVGLLIGVGSLLVPQVLSQLQKLESVKYAFEDPVELTHQLQQRSLMLLDKIPEEYRDDVIERLNRLVEDSTSKVGQWTATGLKYLANFVGQMISGMFFLVTGLIISIYVLQTWAELGPGFLEVLPRNLRRDAEELTVKMNEIFGGYLRATIVTCVACFIATFVALWLLTLVTGVPFPYIYLLSLVAGITYPIPILGILATTILGGILGFVAHPHLAFALWVALVVNIVNNVIDRTVQPKLMSDAIGVSPLFVMFGAFAGGELMGVWGMLLGIPVAAMGKALFTWFHGRFLVHPEAEAVPQPEITPPPEISESAAEDPAAPPEEPV